MCDGGGSCKVDFTEEGSDEACENYTLLLIAKVDHFLTSLLIREPA